MKEDVLKKQLQIIAKVIPFNVLLNRTPNDLGNIARYYRLNRLAYRLINSKNGFVHMGISRNGTFKADDFLEHARIISRYISALNANAVLELAAGKAATTKFLAGTFPATEFMGLDLPNGQLKTSSAQRDNLTLLEGDYHDLSRFTPSSFDVVYIIEALCHAQSKATVISEIERVLRPGGVCIIFDGYVSKPSSAMSTDERLAADLIYTSMMVTKQGHLYEDLRQNLLKAGMAIIEEENLSAFVLPSMKRLQASATKYFRHPQLAKIINAFIPVEVTGNAVAAYLMSTSVELGLHQYWMTIARKR